MVKVNMWRVRAMRRDGEIVWVIYRLLDESGEDETQNRAYWPRGECPAWSRSEAAARHMAKVLNELAALTGEG